MHRLKPSEGCMTDSEYGLPLCVCVRLWLLYVTPVVLMGGIVLQRVVVGKDSSEFFEEDNKYVLATV